MVSFCLNLLKLSNKDDVIGTLRVEGGDDEGAVGISCKVSLIYYFSS